MGLFQNLKNDLRKGENIDLYLTIVAAIGVASLSILGVGIAPGLADSLTLAILGLLAFSALQSRHHFESIASRFQTSHEGQFLHEFPPDFRARLENCRSLLIAGVSQSGMLQEPSYQLLLEKKVQKGDRIRVLLVHPEGVAVEAAVLRSSWESDSTSTRLRITSSLDFVRRLQQISQKNVEVRTIKYQMSYGALLMDFDVKGIDSILYVESYTYKSGHIPKHVLSEKDSEWYPFFKSEVMKMWEDGIANE